MTGRQDRAAQLLAEDELTDRQIAEQLRIARATLALWKQKPEFRRRVEEYRKRYAEQATSAGFARREKRIEALKDRHRRLTSIIHERAADLGDGVPAARVAEDWSQAQALQKEIDAAHSAGDTEAETQALRALSALLSEDPRKVQVPGGKSGLLVRRVRVVGTGRNARRIEEYEVDRTLLAELRAHEQQIAQELGQWVDKREQTNAPADDGRDYKAELLARIETIRARLVAQQAAGMVIPVPGDEDHDDPPKDKGH